MYLHLGRRRRIARQTPGLPGDCQAEVDFSIRAVFRGGPSSFRAMRREFRPYLRLDQRNIDHRGASACLRSMYMHARGEEPLVPLQLVWAKPRKSLVVHSVTRCRSVISVTRWSRGFDLDPLGLPDTRSKSRNCCGYLADYRRGIEMFDVGEIEAGWPSGLSVVYLSRKKRRKGRSLNVPCTPRKGMSEKCEIFIYSMGTMRDK